MNWHAEQKIEYKARMEAKKEIRCKTFLDDSKYSNVNAGIVSKMSAKRDALQLKRELEGFDL